MVDYKKINKLLEKSIGKTKHNIAPTIEEVVHKIEETKATPTAIEEEKSEVDLRFSDKYGWVDVEYFRKARRLGLPAKKAVVINNKECYNYAAHSPEELVEEFLKDIDINSLVPHI